VLNAFGATQPNATSNATSNASQGTSTGNANATVARTSNTASAPLTRRGRNEPVATDTIYADTAAVSTSIQEEKTIEEEQGDADEEEQHYELATDIFPELFSGTTIGNTTPEQTAPSNSSPSSAQIAPPKSSTPMATSPAPSNSNTSPVQATRPKNASPAASPPSRPNPTQLLTPVISTKPGDANAGSINQQPSPMQASPSKASPSSDPKQPVTPVISTKLITADGENTANTLSIQQSPKQTSPTQETQITLIAEPENTSINKSKSSGTNESEKGVMTRQKAVTKGKELKGVNEAEDPEAKAKLLRAIARHRKEKEQKMAIEANEQDKGKVGSSNSPQPEPSNADSQVRSPVVTFKTNASITTPMRSPSTKTSLSTPSDLTKSDSSEQKAQTSNDPHEEPKDISELLPIQNEQDLDDVNELLGDFLGRANKTKQKESSKSNEDSMEEHISSVDKMIKEHARKHSSPAKDTMKEPFGKVVKPPRTIDQISPNSEGGMSLKTVQEHKDKANREKLKAILQAEGINAEEEYPDIFLPDEAKLSKDSKATGASEFVKDLYESAGIIESIEDNTVCMESDEADLLAMSTFADDAYQYAELAGDGGWKTPKTSKKDRKKKTPCDKLRPMNIFSQIIASATGVPVASSGSASDSTVYNSPSQNPYSPLAEDKEEDSENPTILPITDIESSLPANNQPTSGVASNAPEGESEQKRDEEENITSSTQEDPENQDFHKAESE